MNYRRRHAEETPARNNQLRYAVQTAVAVAIMCSIFGIPALFAGNRNLVATTLTTTAFVVGLALLVPRRTRDWGGVVASAATPFYLGAILT